MDKRFYFDGIFYDCEEDFSKAASQFAGSEISPESAERILKHMCNTITFNILNFSNNKKMLSNSELQHLCACLEIEFIQRYRKMMEENDVRRM